ncbi:hypothetical protein BJ912DRAFT_545965 [Pholiota molesta]|nr:hypothetical protein BJ912DRAFT_545965 [Pholiota molesta]
MPHAPLPIELIEIIVDNVAHEHGSDVQATLKNCALACWSFLPICRKHLFASIALCFSLPRQSRRVKHLVTLLRSSPEIADYTRHLRLNLSPKVQPLPTELKLFTRLDTYTLSLDIRSIKPMEPPYIDFDDMAVQTKEILLRPILTLKTLELNLVANFPFYELLRYCPNIRQLDLGNVAADKILIPTEALPLNPIKIEKFSSHTAATDSQAMAIRKLFELQQSNGQPVIDFSGLKHWDINYTDSEEWKSLQAMLLPRSNQLTTIVLTADSHECHLRGLGQLLLPSAKNLKKISIYADILAPEHDPLCGLCEELEILGNQSNHRR